MGFSLSQAFSRVKLLDKVGDELGGKLRGFRVAEFSVDILGEPGFLGGVNASSVKQGGEGKSGIGLQNLMSGNNRGLDKLKDFIQNFSGGSSDIVGQSDKNRSSPEGGEFLRLNHFLQEHDAIVSSSDSNSFKHDLSGSFLVFLVHVALLDFLIQRLESLLVHDREHLGDAQNLRRDLLLFKFLNFLQVADNLSNSLNSLSLQGRRRQFGEEGVLQLSLELLLALELLLLHLELGVASRVLLSSFVNKGRVFIVQILNSSGRRNLREGAKRRPDFNNLQLLLGASDKIFSVISH